MAEGVLLGIGYRRRGSKTRMIGPTKKFDDNFSRMNRMHQRDKTARTPGDSRLRLRIASHGKNGSNHDLNPNRD